MRRVVVLVFAAVLVDLLLWGINPAGAEPPSKYARYLNSVVVIESSKGIGTGFFISDNGLIVTNNHVIGDDLNVRVRMRNQKILTGGVLHTESRSDLAFLAVDEDSPHWLKLANANEGGVGSEVIAIGTAHGLSWSVSRGIVSGIRKLDNITLVQTDAAINPGNSGGPLILLDSGRVVGINTLAFRKDLAEGIGFAVSAESIRVKASFLEQGHVPEPTKVKPRKTGSEKQKVAREKAKIKREWKKIHEERTKLVRERFALEDRKKNLAKEEKRLKKIAKDLERERVGVKANDKKDPIDQASQAPRKPASGGNDVVQTRDPSIAYAVNYFTKMGAKYGPDGFRGAPVVDYSKGWATVWVHEFNNSSLPIHSKFFTGHSSWIIHYAEPLGRKPIPFAWSHLPEQGKKYSLRDTLLYVDITGDGTPRIRFRNSNLAVKRTSEHNYTFKFNPPGWLLRYAGGKAIVSD